MATRAAVSISRFFLSSSVLLDIRTPVAVSPMETNEQKNSKKARVDPPVAPSVICTVSIDKTKLQCPVCTHSLKPPIFQCAAAGHLACGACHGELADKDRCYKCAHPGGYSRCFPLEDVVVSTKAWCPNSFYGCYTPMMTLYEMDEHYRRCPHAPCRCAEPGCGFAGSPAAFGYHLWAAHSWPAHGFFYGKACQLRLPAASNSKQQPPPRCLLVAAEDARAFVVSYVAALRGGGGGVSLVCLRANAAAAEGPHYTCKMWATGSAAAATGKVPTVSVEMEVPSSAAATAETEAALVVPREMLHGPSKELRLSVRIDKVDGADMNAAQHSSCCSG